MSRRSVPPIDSSDLRDHADDERVERIWNRLEADLDANALFDRHSSGDGSSLSEGSTRRSSRPAPRHGWAAAPGRTRAWAVLAAAAMFGGGLYVGRVVGSADVDHSLAARSTKELALDVFASGSESRVFSLPNGASLALDPESTVEVAEISDSGTTLRLLHGSAAVDNTHVGSGSVSIVAGEARLTASAGGVVSVRRNEHDVDVAVTSGTVQVEGPDMAPMQLAPGDRRHVPILRATTLLDPVSPRRTDGPLPVTRGRTASVDERSEHASSSPTVDDAVAPLPSWRAQYNVNQWDKAYDTAAAQGDISTMIDRSQSASELTALSDITGKKKLSALSMKAARRVIDEFPGDPNISMLAMRVANMLTAAQKPELAQKYYELAKRGGQFDSDIDCRWLENADVCSVETAPRATTYLEKFPNGSCRDLAESLVGTPDPQKCDPNKSEPSKNEAPKESEPKAGSSSPTPSSKPAAAGVPGSAPSAPGAQSSSKPAAPAEKAPAQAAPAGSAEKPSENKPNH